MKRKRELTRIAKKQGWYRGHSGEEPVSWPFDEIELCLAYEEGWNEGANAPENAKNPYGKYDQNYVKKSGWYKAEHMKAHFYREGAISSCCGIAGFDDRFIRIENPTEHVKCKHCRG